MKTETTTMGSYRLSISYLLSLGRDITPEDLYNIEKASGYYYVNMKSVGNFLMHVGTRPTHAGQITDDEWGTSRRTGREAAQDFCNWFNAKYRNAMAVAA